MTSSRERFFVRLAYLVVEHPRSVVAAALAVSAVLGFGVARLRLENRFDDMVPAAHPYTLADQRIRGDFGGTLVTVAVVQPRAGTVWRREVLEVVHAITQDLRLLPGVLPYSVTSLAAPSVREIRADADRLDVHYLMREVPTTEDGIAHVRQVVRDNPLFRDVLVSADERAAFISVDFDRQQNDAGISARMREVVAAHATPDIEVLLTGQPIILQALNEYVGTVWMRYVFAFAVILLVLYGSFGSVQAMLLPMLTAMLSCLWGIGIVGLVGVTLDPYTTITPILVMAVAAGHSAQVMKRYYEEFEAHPDNRAAVRASIVTMGPVMVAAGGTAAFGFGSLVLFTLPSFRNFGIVAALGTLSAVCLELTFMPALRCLLPPPRLRVSASRAVTDRLAARLAAFMVGPWRWTIFAGFVLVVALAAASMRHISYAYHVADMLPADTKAKRDLEAVGSRFPSLYSMVIAFRGSEPVAQDPVLIDFVHGLQQTLQRDPAVVRTTSYVDVLAYANRVLGADGVASATDWVPRDRRLAAQLLSLTYSDSYQLFLTRDFRMGAIWVFFPSDDVNAFRRAIRTAEEYRDRTPLPEGVVIDIAGGLAPLIVAFTDTIIHGKLLNIISVMSAVLLVALLLLRSFIGAAMVILPLVVTVAVEFGLMGAFGISLNPSTATISAMSVGIGADYAIYLLYRFRDEYGRCADLERALAATLRTSGVAVASVALAIGMGYGTLIFSSFEPFRMTGIFVMTAMVVSCLSAVLLMMTGITVLRPRFIFAAPAGARAAPLEIREGALRAVLVPPGDATLLQACFALRDAQYVGSGWVGPDQRSPDRYDAVSAQLAVLDGDQVVATLRSTPWIPGIGFMLDREFAVLVDDPARLPPRAQDVEVSRLATAPGDRHARLGHLLLLFRLWARLDFMTWVEHAYFVTDDRLLPNFGAFDDPIRRFVEPLGPWRSLNGGRPCRAMRLDVVAAIGHLETVSPDVAAMVYGSLASTGSRT